MSTLGELVYVLKTILIIHGIFRFAFCCEMGLRLTDKQNVYATINISSFSTRFYFCMSQKCPACVLHLFPQYGNNVSNYEVFMVECENKNYVNKDNTSTYQCIFSKIHEINTSVNPILCLSKKDECTSIRCSGKPAFKINWGFANEYIIDKDIEICRNQSTCSMIYIAPVDTSSTFSTITSWSSSTALGDTGSTTVTPAFSTVKIHNNTTSEDTDAKTNMIIIITVFCCVSILVCICICIAVYYVHKRMNLNKTQNTLAHFANHGTDNNTALTSNSMDFTGTASNSNDISSNIKESFLYTYDEYNRYSVNNSSKLHSINKVDTPYENSISEQQEEVSQNIDPATKSPLTKHYATLNEDLKVREHDYNCLVPDSRDTENNKLVIFTTNDSSLINTCAGICEYIEAVQPNYISLVPKQGDTEMNTSDNDIVTDSSILNHYDRLGEHVRVVYQEYNCLPSEHGDC